LFATVVRKFSLGTQPVERLEHLVDYAQIKSLFDGIDWNTETNKMKQAVWGGQQEFIEPAFLVWNKNNDFELYISCFDAGVYEVHFSMPLDDHEVQEFISQKVSEKEVAKILEDFFGQKTESIKQTLLKANTPNGPLYQHLQQKRAAQRHKWFYSGTGLRVVLLYFSVAGLLAFLASQNFFIDHKWKWAIWGGSAIFSFLSLATAEKIKKVKSY
jgi:hypothetical protein